MEIQDANKILIVRFSSLGDVLLTTPVVRAIKKLNPNIELHFLVRKEFADSIRYNPYISNVIEFKKDEPLLSLLNELQSNNYDLIVDLQNNRRSNKISKFLKLPVQKYIKPTINKLLLVKFGWNRYKELLTIPELYVKNLIKIELDEKGLDFFLPEEPSVDLQVKSNNLAFCVGAKHFTKRYPEEYFVELGNQLTDAGYTIHVLGGKDDKELCEKISRQIKGSVNASTNDNLFETAKNMMKCEYVFCNDSGLMHLASALNKPVVVFFGSSVKELGFTPYKTQNLILENNSLSCRPCSHIGRDKCPKKHFDCMMSLSPEKVFAEFGKFKSKK